ncbi:hypothetical protein VQH23_22435 [Pararoseomonas sp. SCSIO 73927]|uniref:hypothetical protein n=1 Tax=Pararoseomonas sp. SCSIO 73927 TaxID=3114537 RepID=UPI0030CCBDE6
MSGTAEGAPPAPVLSLSRAREDRLWAVVAAIGRKTRIAEIHASRAAADADRSWREQQVRAYASFLRGSGMPLPNYSVSSIRRADLPRSWRPLPALGFLRGQFI